MFVGGIVVEHRMDQLSGGDFAFDGVEEADEFAAALALHAAADDGAVEHAERGEQGGREVPLVIVGNGLTMPRPDRPSRLGAVERLDLALFVEREHHSVGRRIDPRVRPVTGPRAGSEPNDIGELGGKAGITQALEGTQTMRQVVGLPDALHRTQRDTDRLGHRPAGSVGRLVRRLRARQRHDPRCDFHRDRCLSGFAGFVAQQAFNPNLGVALLPAPYRRSADATRAATRCAGSRSAEARTMRARSICFRG
jgi:hypothetical protein